MTAGDAAPAPTPPVWIDDDATLRTLAERIASLAAFAVDTESNSLHAYTERVCLVQLSIPGEDFLVDPFAVDLAPLGALVADPNVCKVMHGADYDILSLKRAFDFSFRNLWDTMLAERVLGRSGYGLGTLLAEHFGFRADKKMQRFDWGQRPLPEHAIDYARYDTHFLLRLQTLQRDALVDADRLEDHTHACLRQVRVVPRSRPFDPDSFWKIKGARQLDAPGPAVLKELYVLRDAMAREIDRPVFRVMSDAVLLELARRRPADRRALDRTLGRVRGSHPMIRRRRLDDLGKAIARGQAADPPAKPTRTDAMPKRVTSRYDALRGWRKEYAAGRGVEPDIVLDKNTLLELAQALDGDPLRPLDSWERERYGDAIKRTLAAAG